LLRSLHEVEIHMHKRSAARRPLSRPWGRRPRERGEAQARRGAGDGSMADQKNGDARQSVHGAAKDSCPARARRWRVHKHSAHAHSKQQERTGAREQRSDGRTQARTCTLPQKSKGPCPTPPQLQRRLTRKARQGQKAHTTRLRKTSRTGRARHVRNFARDPRLMQKLRGYG